MRRKIDNLGRIVLPAKYRQELHIQKNDELDIHVSATEIIIKKPVPGCIFCNAALNLVRIDNLCVCRPCIERLHHAKTTDALYPIHIE